MPAAFCIIELGFWGEFKGEIAPLWQAIICSKYRDYQTFLVSNDKTEASCWRFVISCADFQESLGTLANICIGF